MMALFIIIVLAFLGLAMIQISSDSSRAMVYEVYGARALNAANSGANRAINAVLGPAPNLECTSTIGQFYSLPDITAFSGCTVNVSCESFVITETNFTHYQFISSAACDAGEFITQSEIVIEARQRD